MKSIESWQPKTADLEVLRRVKAAILKVVPDAHVILYGSRARGDTADPYADYDILVLVDGPADMRLQDRLRDAVYTEELETDSVVCFIIRNRREWGSAAHRATPLHENVEREGVVV